MRHKGRPDFGRATNKRRTVHAWSGASPKLMAPHARTYAGVGGKDLRQCKWPHVDITYTANFSVQGYTYLGEAIA